MDPKPPQDSRAPKKEPDDEAVAWFVRLRSPHCTREDLDAFRAWLKQSPEHARSYQELAALWDDTDLNEALERIEKRSSARDRTAPSATFRRRTGPLAGAFSLILVVFVTLHPVARWQADYFTEIGERRSVALRDGSELILNTDSALAVNLTPSERRVELLRGEVLFEVAPNAVRPFIVHSGSHWTRVLGTRFLVRQEGETTTVTVVKGQVEVGSDASLRSVRLKTLERVEATPEGLGETGHVAAGRAESWTKGWLSFDDASLETVVKELRRYRNMWVLFRDEGLKDYRISGRFDIGNPDNAIKALEQSLPIKVTRLGPWLLVIG